MADTKEKILMTALQLFARNGYEAVSVRNIAEELGMTVGTPCYAFAPNRSHSICLANQALKENVGKYRVAAVAPRMAFWIPVAGVPDVYVHSFLPLPDNNDTPNS